MQKNPKATGDKFLQLFNELEHLLGNRSGKDDYMSFYALLESVSKRMPTVNRNLKSLQSMGRLRNAIVHARGFPEKIIADPRQEIVDDLQRILDSIKSPVRVDQKFRRDIQVFRPEASVGEILAHMRQNDYSQVVLRIEGIYKVLTSEAIVRWLSNSAEKSQNFDSVSALEVYQNEKDDVQKWLYRKAPVDEALQIFENALERGIPRLHAILITESGKPTERPIGIITPWDLVDILKKET